MQYSNYSGTMRGLAPSLRSRLPEKNGIEEGLICISSVVLISVYHIYNMSTPV